MTILESKPDGKYVTSKKKFVALRAFKSDTIIKTLDFAYDMTFGAGGVHRAHRSGGTHIRSNKEIFIDTFQGKLAEFAIYNHLHKDHSINQPDLDVWGEGKWDDEDFIIDGKRVSVKSAKYFSQLLLLETKDWNNQGLYIPDIHRNGGEYDYFIFVRIKPSCADLIAGLVNLDKAEIQRVINSQKWEYDIPGYVTRNEFIEAIQQGNIIYKYEKLNGKMPMDADNYYIQACDMHPISAFETK